MKERYGSLSELKLLGEKMKLRFTKEQLIDKKLKNYGGESREQVVKRMNEIFNEIVIGHNENKNIALVSHGASIKFFLSQYCNLNDDIELVYNGKIVKVSSPGVIKLEVIDGKVKSIEQIY